MVYMATVENGEANLRIDTTSMKKGKYKLQTNYLQNDYYNNATVDSYLSLTEQLWTRIADISTTSTEWTKTPQADGIHATNQWHQWKQQIPNNTLIKITGNYINGTEVRIGLQDTLTNNKNSINWSENRGIHTWGQIGERILTQCTWNTGPFTLEITNQSGEFTFKINNETPITVNINSDKLNTSYLAFYAGSGDLIISDVRYKPVTTGGG